MKKSTLSELMKLNHELKLAEQELFNASFRWSSILQRLRLLEDGFTYIVMHMGVTFSAPIKVNNCITLMNELIELNKDKYNISTIIYTDNPNLEKIFNGKIKFDEGCGIKSLDQYDKDNGKIFRKFIDIKDIKNTYSSCIDNLVNG